MNADKTPGIGMVPFRPRDDGNIGTLQVGLKGIWTATRNEALSQEPARPSLVLFVMRTALTLLPLIALAACDKPAEKPEVQPGVVANISDRTERAPDTPPPVNATVPAESPAPDERKSGSIPTALQGRWTGVTDKCGDRMADLELNILPNQLVFHESVGMVEAVTPEDDGQLSVKAAFTGEGQSWSRTLTLRPAADGATLTIINDGTAVTRKRC